MSDPGRAAGTRGREENLRGALWRGRRGDDALVVALWDFAYAKEPDVFDRWLRFDVPGIAPLAFLGVPDDARSATAVLAEVRPAGEPLATAAPIDEAAAVRLGIALCDVIRAHHYLDAPRPAFGGGAALGAVLERALAGTTLADLREALAALDRG